MKNWLFIAYFFAVITALGRNPDEIEHQIAQQNRFSQNEVEIKVPTIMFEGFNSVIEIKIKNPKAYRLLSNNRQLEASINNTPVLVNFDDKGVGKINLHANTPIDFKISLDDHVTIFSPVVIPFWAPLLPLFGLVLGIFLRYSRNDKGLDLPKGVVVNMEAIKRNNQEMRKSISKIKIIEVKDEEAEHLMA